MVPPPTVQAPAPSHFLAAVAVPLAQLAGTQTVVLSHFAQPPEPSHFPLRPQLVSADAAHIDRGSAMFAGVFVHVPDEHVLQAPVQSLLQQTPSTQWPLVHSMFALQAAAFGNVAPHLPGMNVPHLLGALHDVSPVHELKHAFPAVLQTYGSQFVVEPARHAPAPSHVLAVVAVPFVQVAAAQIAPSGYFWQAPAPLQKPLLPQLATPWSVH